MQRKVVIERALVQQTVQRSHIAIKQNPFFEIPTAKLCAQLIGPFRNEQ